MKRLKTTLLCLFLFFMPGEMSGMSTEDLSNQDDELLIGTRVVAPFVIKETDGSYSGITISLWEHIAEELNLDFTYVEDDIQGMLDGVERGDYFAAASALTATSEREEFVDFTHPFYVTGLGIAVPHQPAGLWGAISSMFSFDFLWVLFLLLGLLFIWGILVWFFERHENRDEFGGSTAEGIGSGFWWAAVTMTTVGYGDKSPRTIGGRVVGFLWMFTAIIVISFFTASIASSLTVTQLDSRVSGPADLPNARVGVLQQSATQSYMESEGIRAQHFETLSDGLDAVNEGDLDAFVHDAPIIGYMVQQSYLNEVRMLSNTFNDQYYGVVLQSNSGDRNRINQIILSYINSDEWESMLTDYFGSGK